MPKGFRPVAVLVNNRRHDFIAQGIQALCGSLLWHKQSGRIGEGVNKPVDCDLGIRGVVDANAQS